MKRSAWSSDSDSSLSIKTDNLNDTNIIFVHLLWTAVSVAMLREILSILLLTAATGDFNYLGLTVNTNLNWKNISKRSQMGARRKSAS